MAANAKQKRFSWKRLFAILAVLAPLAYGALRVFEYVSVYLPTREMSTFPVWPERPRQEVTLSSDGLRLNAWFFPAPTNSPRRQYVFLLCHGNGGNISWMRNYCDLVFRTGAGLMLFDYRGFGRSEGHPSEEGTYDDAKAAYRWLRQAGFADTNVLVYGQSLGGGVASELAAREQVGALILESTFTSITAMGEALYPWLPSRTLGTIHYDTKSRLADIRVPVLIMHSREDRLVPYKQAEENYALANEPKLLWEIKGGHAAGDARCYDGLEILLAALEHARQAGGKVTLEPGPELKAVP